MVDKEALFSEAMKQVEALAPEAPKVEAPAEEPELAESDGKLEPADAPEVEESPKPVEPPVKEAAKPAVKTLEDRAREAAARRKAAGDTAMSARAKALLEAAESGDAMALLTAAKIPWNAAAKQVLEGKVEKAKAEEPSAAETRIAALENQLKQQQAQTARAQVLTQVRDLAKSGGKYKLVTGLGNEEQALQYLEQYHLQTGELPAETFEESIHLALEAVENQLSREADRWRPLLGSTTTKAPVEKPVAPKAVSQQAAKSLTNDTGSGPKPAPGTRAAPKSSDDYFNEALKILETQPTE